MTSWAIWSSRDRSLSHRYLPQPWTRPAEPLPRRSAGSLPQGPGWDRNATRTRGPVPVADDARSRRMPSRQLGERHSIVGGMRARSRALLSTVAPSLAEGCRSTWRGTILLDSAVRKRGGRGRFALRNRQRHRTIGPWMRPRAPILEVGALLLAAAGAGWLARRLRPAGDRRLPRGRVCWSRRSRRATWPTTTSSACSPTSASSSSCSRSASRSISADSGASRARCCGRRRSRPVITSGDRQRRVPRGRPRAVRGAALLGLCVALSSSVVIVNITRSRRRTTIRQTERRARSAGACSRTSPAWPSRSSCWRSSARAGRSSRRLVGLAAFGALGRRGGAAPAACRSAGCAPSTTCSCIVSVASGLALAGAGAVAGRHPARAGRVRRRPRDHREPRCGRGAPPAPAVPRRVRGVLLRRDRDADRPGGARPRPALARPGRRPRRRREVGRSPTSSPGRPGCRAQPAPGRRRPRSDRRVQLRPGLGGRSRAGRSARTSSPRCSAAVAVTIAGSTDPRPARRPSPGRADPDRRGAEPGRSGSSVEHRRPGREAEVERRRRQRRVGP